MSRVLKPPIIKDHPQDRTLSGQPFRRDSNSDEIAIQIVNCSQCNFAAIAVYEESRRGAMNSESYDHRGYRVSAADLKAVRQMIEQCPRPRDKRCTCAAHRRLGNKDPSGRWNGLSDIALEGRFNLVF